MMNRSWPTFPYREVVRVLVLLGVISLGWSEYPAQTPEPNAVRIASPVKAVPVEEPALPEITGEGKSENAEAAKPAAPQFRVEKLPISSGAELITIFGRLDGLKEKGKPAPEVPLVSVLRDTLGDDNSENDRLRYVWMLTHTQPSMAKRVAAAIPFFYNRVGNKTNVSGPPTPILNLAHAKRATWNRFFWWGLQNAFFDTYGLPLKASSRSYRQNLSDYRQAHVAQALSILGTFEKLQQRSRDESEFLAKRNDDAPASDSADSELNGVSTPLIDLQASFTPVEMLELRARLLLSNNTFGGLYGPDKFESTVTGYGTKSLDHSGHNWDLLRQQAEAEGLFFESLTMPDGTPTHVMLWISKDDLEKQKGRRYSGRFLSISNPWADKRLADWKGYSETWYLDDENRRTSAASAARRVEMIPLAVYGLNQPKIPALLIDFRASLNPKKREMSRRAFNDVTNNILSLSSFGNLPYFAGRKIYGFITGRRGIDLNQPSRARSYSELKLLLAFNSKIDPKLRDELQQRLETVSLNPLSNDLKSEIELAQKQYAELVQFAQREKGLPAKVERDRREEMMPLAHGPAMRFLFGLGNVLTFGRYVHREDATPELHQRMELARRVRHHTEFLERVARSSPQIEVAWEMPTVRTSLRFLADNAQAANGSAAKVAAKVFENTNDSESRTLCLDVLSRINDKTARKEMLRLFREEQANSEWRALLAERLRKAVKDDERIKPSHARMVLAEIGGQQ